MPALPPESPLASVFLSGSLLASHWCHQIIQVITPTLAIVPWNQNMNRYGIGMAYFSGNYDVGIAACILESAVQNGKTSISTIVVDTSQLPNISITYYM